MSVFVSYEDILVNLWNVILLSTYFCSSMKEIAVLVSVLIDEQVAPRLS